MSQQYPDGPYLVTYNDGHQRADMLRTSISGAQHICGTTPDWLIERGCTLTPLVPALTEPTLEQMLIDIRRKAGGCALIGYTVSDPFAWWVEWPDNREGTPIFDSPSEAIRAAWEAVCKP